MSISGGSAMEQARYWMWMKRKNTLKPQHIQASMMNSFNDSWEEQAFAEDAAGPLGGCVWPPRSYSCNFCRREFRSAQALGGHMNVHRRDRARLKQSLSPHHEVQNDQNHDQKTCKSLGAQYPSEVGTIEYNQNNPNCNPSFVSSPHSPSRISASSTQENFSEHTFVSLYSSSNVQEHHSKTEVEKSPRIEESISLGRNNYVETNLSLGLDLVVGRNRPTGSSSDEAIRRKKHKTTTVVSSLPFFLKLCLNDRYHVHSDVHGVLHNSSMEDLDLELRLGDTPKVN
ncbi:hypothetical protein L1049_012022 [Liquidambar formosana]|uniref:C2H2-type domain-containing protein n=1 Tax=Liquidambar formosana TaxID=63359 RepID=A0AAP0RSD0_LIQFO